MIIIDTNVVSETLRPSPDMAMVAWLDAQPAEALFLTSVSLAELLLGVALLPEGRRKSELAHAIGQNVTALFGNRILAFDAPAAAFYAAVMSSGRAAGFAISIPDGQIAAIAKLHGFTVATRDTKPFTAAGVGVINPWTGVV